MRKMYAHLSYFKALPLCLCVVLCTVFGSTLAFAAGHEKTEAASTMSYVSGGNVSNPDASGVDVFQSLDKAFSYSPNIQSLQEGREQASYEVRAAEGGYYPTIGIWAGGGVTQESTQARRRIDNYNDPMGTVNVGLGLSQTIWEGGATSSLVRNRKAALESSKYLILDNATTLAMNTISAHVDILRWNRLIHLSKMNVDEHKYILRLLQARFKQGLSSKGDLEQVVSRLNRAQTTLLLYQESLAATKSAYRRLVGEAPPADLLPVDTAPKPYESAEKVREACLQSNYRLLTLLEQIDMLIGERDYARSAFAPYISLDAGPSYSNVDSGGNAYELSWTAMLNLQWNLYNGGEDMATFKANSAEVRAARKSLHDTMDILDEQIDIVHNRVVIAAEQALHFEAASKASFLARDNFFSQFELGQKDLLNVLDAETEAFTAAVDAEIAKTDALLGEYQLHALAGTLLHTMNVNVSALTKALPQSTDKEKLSPWSFTSSPKEATIDMLKGSTLHRTK